MTIAAPNGRACVPIAKPPSSRTATTRADAVQPCAGSERCVEWLSRFTRSDEIWNVRVGRTDADEDCGQGTKRKDSSHLRQGNATIDFTISSRHRNALSNITVIRRQNVLTLFQRYAEEQMRAGIAPKGLEQSFAQKLQISPSMWSQIKGSRPIGDKLARQIESACRQTTTWLDEERAGEGLTAGEQQFLALALKAWRGTNAAGRKTLKAMLKGMGEGAS